MTDDQMTIIPAEPGWRLCDPISDGPDKVDDIVEIEVIAWAVTYSLGRDGVPCGFATAITADTGTDRRALPLRSPSGRYFLPEDRDFLNRQAVIDYLRGGA